MKSYILLDFDGVIVDSMSYWETLGSNFLKAEGKIPEKGLKEIIKPMTMEESACYFREKYQIEGSIENIIKRMIHHMEEKYLSEIPLKEGVLEAFNIWKTKKQKMAIVTASEEDIVLKVLKRFQIDTFIEFVLTCTEVHCSKREPEIYSMAADRFGVGIEETILLDDDIMALKAAKSAGAQVAGVQDQSNQTMAKEILGISGYYLKHLTELS